MRALLLLCLCAACAATSPAAICNPPTMPQWLVKALYAFSTRPISPSWMCQNQVQWVFQKLGEAEQDDLAFRVQDALAVRSSILHLKTTCDDERQAIADAQAGLNLNVLWPVAVTTGTATTTLTLAMGTGAAPSDFFTATYDTTAWFSLSLQQPPASACVGSFPGACASPYFALPSALWTQPHSLQCDANSCAFADISAADLVFAPGTLLNGAGKRFVQVR